MSEITILNEMPVIITKDYNYLEEFARNGKRVVPGQIILIPDDAVLVMLPELKTLEASASSSENLTNNKKEK